MELLLRVEGLPAQHWPPNCARSRPATRQLCCSRLRSHLLPAALAPFYPCTLHAFPPPRSKDARKQKLKETAAKMKASQKAESASASAAE